MIGFRFSAQRPPEPTRINEVVVQRYEHIYEVDPALMRDHVQQHDFPAWDTRRIVDSRWEHLAWMHAHWADSVIDGSELEGEGPLESEGSE